MNLQIVLIHVFPKEDVDRLLWLWWFFEWIKITLLDTASFGNAQLCW